MTKKFIDVFRAVLKSTGLSEAEIELRYQAMVHVEPGVQATFDQPIADEDFAETVEKQKQVLANAVVNFERDPIAGSKRWREHYQKRAKEN